MFVTKNIKTPLGDMIAISDREMLYLLQFNDQKNLEKQIKPFKCIRGDNQVLELLEKELELYFLGRLKDFSIPMKLSGTPFQMKVWQLLITVGYGTTSSYREQSIGIGAGGGYRAVGSANAKNKLAILVPCHRVISSSGSLSGYAGGIERKKWLLEHEKSK